MKIINCLYRIIYLAFLLSVSSCSVKENRSMCPCILKLDFSDTDTSLVKSVQLFLTDQVRTIYSSCLDSGTFMPEYEIKVPRTQVNLNIYAGLDEEIDSGEGFRIPLGRDCPEVYMSSAKIDTDFEKICHKVALKKNYCRMNIEMIKDDDLTYDLCVKSNIDGYDTDGKPNKGVFSYRPKQGQSGIYSLNLPRQVDSSMTLEVDDGTEVLKVFALGEYVSACGYDWSAENLEDIDVSIDWAMTTIKLTVQGWDSVYEYEIII